MLIYLVNRNRAPFLGWQAFWGERGGESAEEVVISGGFLSRFCKNGTGKESLFYRLIMEDHNARTKDSGIDQLEIQGTF
jgi:hypothetical protein